MDATLPSDDSGYLERLSQAIFMAGLNWKVIENKWPHFKIAFSGFSPEKVARISGKRVRELMNDAGIVRNEKKIAATIENANVILGLQRDFGSVKEYIRSFGNSEEKLQRDLQARFSHVGPSTARTFLWMVGYRLTPTKEERAWLKAHRG